MASFRKERFILEYKTFNKYPHGILNSYYKKLHTKIFLKENPAALHYLIIQGINIAKLVESIEIGDIISVNGNFKLIKFLTNLGSSFEICSELSIKDIIEQNKTYLFRYILRDGKYDGPLCAIAMVNKHYKEFGFSSIVKYNIRKIINSNDYETIVTIMAFVINNNYYELFKYVINNIELSNNNNILILYSAIIYNKIRVIKYLVRKIKLDSKIVCDGLSLANAHSRSSIIKFLTKYQKLNI